MNKTGTSTAEVLTEVDGLLTVAAAGPHDPMKARTATVTTMTTTTVPLIRGLFGLHPRLIVGGREVVASLVYVAAETGALLGLNNRGGNFIFDIHIY